MKTLFPKEKDALEVDSDVLENARVAYGIVATNSRVAAVGDDDFVETPPQFVASGSSHSLPAICPQSAAGGCSSPMSDMPQASLSSMHAQLRALEACNKRLEESNIRLETSNTRLEESNKVVIYKLSSLKSDVQEGILKLHNLFSSYFLGKQDSHGSDDSRLNETRTKRRHEEKIVELNTIEENYIEEEGKTKIVDDDMVENNSKEEDEKEDESEEEEVHLSNEDNDENEGDDADDDEDNEKFVGRDNDGKEEEKGDNDEKYSGGKNDEDAKIDNCHGICEVLSQVDQVAEVDGVAT
ncbi:uncharacterized protein LOC133822495 isoform X2 [Humulus lupulus]|uniref:uncharacterized protein LOC133822495 isoform X2 n=1 Tax=Humulus lupulus TaxID=3486 RepID=UPI002B40CFCA|nr:uncharacterized protein LOC133822495 isoform X2 [Humulus lupulus]